MPARSSNVRPHTRPSAPRTSQPAASRSRSVRSPSPAPPAKRRALGSATTAAPVTQARTLSLPVPSTTPGPSTSSASSAVPTSSIPLPHHGFGIAPQPTVASASPVNALSTSSEPGKNGFHIDAQNRIWRNAEGDIFSSPNASIWPAGVPFTGPPRSPALDSHLHLREPYAIGWWEPGAAYRAFVPRHTLVNDPVLSSLQDLPIESAIIEAKDLNGQDTYTSRFAQEWFQLQLMFTPIAAILFSHLVFRPQFPYSDLPSSGLGWFSGHSPDLDYMKSLIPKFRKWLMVLAANMSYMFAIARYMTGVPDQWMHILDNYGFMNEHRVWYNRLKASWVTDLSTTYERVGCFFDAKEVKWRHLLQMHVDAGVPVFIYWGRDATSISAISWEHIPSYFLPSPDEISRAIPLHATHSQASVNNVSVSAERAECFTEGWHLEWRGRYMSWMEISDDDGDNVRKAAARVSKWQLTGKHSVVQVTDVSTMTGEARLEQVTKKHRKAAFEACDPWDTRFDPTSDTWYLFMEDIFPVPPYVANASGKLSVYDQNCARYKAENNPCFTVADWELLAALADEPDWAALRCAVLESDRSFAMKPIQKASAGAAIHLPSAPIAPATQGLGQLQVESTSASAASLPAPPLPSAPSLPFAPPPSPHSRGVPRPPTPSASFPSRPSAPSISAPSVQPRAGPRADWCEHHARPVGAPVVRVPGLQSLLDRLGFQWRSDHVIVKLPSTDMYPQERHMWCISWDSVEQQYSKVAPVGKQSPILTTLRILGVWDGTTYDDDSSIHFDFGLSFEQARELMDFVHRLANTGRYVNAVTTGVVDPTSAQGEWAQPHALGWLYACQQLERDWAVIKKTNSWHVHEASVLDKSTTPPTRQAVWALSQPDHPRQWYLVLYDATIVVEILRSNIYSTPDSLLWYCVESCIRVSTAYPHRLSPAGTTAGRQLASMQKSRATQLQHMRLGYMPQGSQVTPTDYQEYEHNCPSVLADKNVLGAMLKRGGIVTRIALEYFPPTAVTAAGPDARLLGLGLDLEIETDDGKVFVGTDDAMTDAMECCLLGGYYDEVHSQLAPDVVRTYWPRSATWRHAFRNASWDEEQERFFQSRRNGYLVVKPDSTSQASLHQPRSTTQWKSAIANRNVQAKRMWIGAEAAARQFLSTRAKNPASYTRRGQM